MFWPFRARRSSAPGAVTAKFSSGPTPVDDMFRSMLSAEGPVSRDEALSVAAVARGRNLLCSISTLPLREYNAAGEVVDNPLLAQLDPDVPNVVTIAQTVEDLIFDGIAWWRITGFSWTGFPATVRRVDPRSVSVHPPAGRTPAPLPSGVDPRQAVVWVDGRPVPASEMIRFDSPQPPICKVGARAIRRAILLDKAAKMYAENPAPVEYFTPAENGPDLDEDDIRAKIREWIAARRRRSTAYVPASLKLNTVSSPSPVELQLVELQRQAWLEICNLMGVDPEDVGLNTTSRTYFNAQDRRLSRVNDVLAPYMLAFSQRLSMNDVTPRGHAVRFDLDDYMKADPATRWQTYEKAIQLGVYGPEYVQVLEDVPPEFRARPAEEPAEAPNEPGATDDIPEPQEAAVEASEPARQFSRSGERFVDIPLQTFSVDTEKRVIEGVALPYGKSAKGIRFERGALQYADVRRVKLDVDHDPKQTIGVATEINDSPNGLRMKFRVAPTPEGDRALLLAAEGVYDGLSVDVDFDPVRDAVADPRAKTGLLVKRADLRRVALTASPAFDDARVTRVAASNDTKEETVADTDTNEPVTAPEPAKVEVPAQFSADELSALRELLADRQKPAAPVREFVDPRRPVASTVVREGLPYRFDRGGRFVVEPGGHVFSADLHEMALRRDHYGETEAGKRVMALIRATFDVDSADVATLNPAIQRPDMFVDQRDFRYPIWNAINKGAPPNGIQPFTFPKYNSSSGLVADHTEGTEPSSGTLTTTSQTVTPTPVSGKASITREVWDMGGNPAVSTLIWNQMVRGYREGLEAAAAAFLNTLTAATDINLGAGVTDEQLAAAWDLELAGLNFVRGYDFTVFVLEQNLYKAFVSATASDGRKIYPMINPTNANGEAEPRYARLNLGGVVGIPSWALPATAGAANNSWLFDPAVVHGWATAPQRLEFAGADTSGNYAPVAMVDIAIWGYKAFTCSDIGGVRQVIYDTTA